MAYDLPATVLTSQSLEERLAPVYHALRLRVGQLEALTGIRERRWWNPGERPSQGAIRAAQRLIQMNSIPPDKIGAVIYAGVCRDNLEPATACAVAAALGLKSGVEIYDISNACLGVMNAIVTLANRIELGQIEAGLIVSCESAREINEVMIDEMNRTPTMEMFKYSIATLTGGSGAVAMLLSNPGMAARRPKLLGGVIGAAPEHHALCRWGDDRRAVPYAREYFETDSVAVQKNGILLGIETWRKFLGELQWEPATPAHVITHQVGGPHRDGIYRALALSEEKDFSTYEFLGNMGTVSLPLTAALAWERGVVAPGDNVAFLGIGSGLNCLMLGWEW